MAYIPTEEEMEKAFLAKPPKSRRTREPAAPRLKKERAPKEPKEPKVRAEKPRKQTAVEKRLNRAITRNVDRGIKEVVLEGIKKFNKNPGAVTGPLKATFSFLAKAGIVAAAAASVVKLWTLATASASERLDAIAERMLQEVKKKIPPAQWTPQVETALRGQYRAWAEQEDTRLRAMTYTK